MRHLLHKDTADTPVGGIDMVTIRGACANVLSLSLEELEENVPLASYGLDSLTSVRLSGLLKQSFDISVTQLQLLSSFMTGE